LLLYSTERKWEIKMGALNMPSLKDTYRGQYFSQPNLTVDSAVEIGLDEKVIVEI
jgi:hypothetical protein